MLTNAALKSLKPKAKMYKVSDRDGMYVRVAPSGAISFRLDYRLNGRRETVYLGRYARDGISLARARELCIDARHAIAEGRSAAIEKQQDKRRIKEAKSFGQFGEKWLTNATMADSTRAMRRSIFERELMPVWRNRLLTEITPDDLRAHCGKIVERGAPATAIHVRDILKQIYGFAILHGEKVANPADDVGPASIASSTSCWQRIIRKSYMPLPIARAQRFSGRRAVSVSWGVRLGWEREVCMADSSEAHRAKRKRPYNERSDLEKLQSQWNKLSGLHLREEPSAAIVRCSTAAEIAANYAIRHEWARQTEFDAAIVDQFLLWANGLRGKIDRLFVPIYFAHPKQSKTAKALIASAEKINKVRNEVVHQGRFSNQGEAEEIIAEAKRFIDMIVSLSVPRFDIQDRKRSE